jgi:hypothetical protein
MSKPKTIHDLLIGQHISLRDVEDIARNVFDGKTTSAGPEGYVITACSYDDLPNHIRDFVRKAFFFFAVENVLDANDGDLFDGDDPVEDNRDN